jgi:hypothetical protein
MKSIITYLLLTATLFAEPADLAKNRETLETKKKELDSLYMNWLEKRISEASLDEQGAYVKELKTMKGEPLDTSKVIVSNVVEGRAINVDAKKGHYRIGKLKAGDKIRLQYDSGIWTSYPDWPKESPENPRIGQHRLHFVVKDGDVESVSVTLTDTAKKPFEHTMEKDGDVYLMMEGVDVINDNDGVVKYRMEIVKN